MAKTHNNFLDYDEKVLPSITHETLKSVIANYNASSLLTNRNEVSFLSTIYLSTFLYQRVYILSQLQVSLGIRDELVERAKDFQIILDDVAITDTGFSPRFTQVNHL